MKNNGIIVNGGNLTAGSIMIEEKSVLKKKKNNFKKEIFLSYSHSDIELALSLKDILTDAGLIVNMDIEAITIGEKIDEYIEKSIIRSEMVLSLVTENSIKSPWFMKEFLDTINVERVINKRKLFPVVIKNIVSDLFLKDKMRDGIDYDLNQINHVIKEETLDMNHIGSYCRKRERLINIKFNVDNILFRIQEHSNFTIENRKLLSNEIDNLVKSIHKMLNYS